METTATIKDMSDSDFELVKQDIHEKKEAAKKKQYEIYRAFLESPTHGHAADIVFFEEGKNIVFDSNVNEFYIKDSGCCYYETVFDMNIRIRSILELSIIFLQDEGCSDLKITDLHNRIGKALQKAQTRDFLNSTRLLFKEMVSVQGISWNNTHEVIVTKSGIVDFTEDSIFIRSAYKFEYFKDPIPIPAEDIKNGKDICAFDRFMKELFPDSETRKSAWHCLGMLISNKPSKTFMIWTNRSGNGGKNCLSDVIINLLIPKHANYISGALILHKPDSGEKRFAGAALQGQSAVFFDEVGGAFDAEEIKRLSGLSNVCIERKGVDGYEIKPNWTMVALCNQLPTINNVRDPAFFSRLFILPFENVFYSDETEKKRYQDIYNIPESHLMKAREKTEILNELQREAAGILNALIIEYMEVRNNGGRPYASPACEKAKNEYRSTNDILECFFSEFLQKDELGRIEIDIISEKYCEYSGKKWTNRTISRELRERFPFIESRAVNGKRYLTGIREK